MDKQTFYTQLSEKLSALGVGEEYINRHLNQFDNYFSEKSDEEVSQEISKLGSIDRGAARIKRITEKTALDNESNEHQAATETVPCESNSDADETESEKSSEKRQQTGEFSFVTRKKEPAYEASLAQKYDSNTPPQNRQSSASLSSKDISNQDIKRSKVKSVTETPLGTVGYTVPDNETIKNNTRKFWLLFAATLPLTAAVVFAVALLFASAFFAIAVLIIAAVALLVAMTAAGTLTSVFGLIFGVAQMLSSLPIGLYECGLSIIIGSVVLFCGILVYNFAVRLMPFAAKWLLVFAKYVIKKAKELYVYFKKECIGG